ncbi:hypothetical protein ACFL0M_15365 [Thermodesulfobacteriota bacterium]
MPQLPLTWEGPTIRSRLPWTLLFHFLVRKDPFAIDARLGELDRTLLGNNHAKAAIDCAL